MEYLSLVPATALGYLTFRATTHPTSRIRKKLPNLKIKRIQFFPVIRVYAFGRVFHFHHWFNFSLLLAASSVAPMGVFDLVFAKGVMMGGLIHGLTMPKGHKKLIYRDFSYDKLTSPTRN